MIALASAVPPCVAHTIGFAIPYSASLGCAVERHSAETVRVTVLLTFPVFCVVVEILQLDYPLVHSVNSGLRASHV